jgi:hypothetical protein
MYARDDISWSIWLWKDIGFQGMVYVAEDTPYMRLIKPFLAKKKVSEGAATDSRHSIMTTRKTAC